MFARRIDQVILVLNGGVFKQVDYCYYNVLASIFLFVIIYYFVKYFW